MFLKISSIEPNHNQPRMEFREESLIELAESMKEYGVLQPLLVQKKKGISTKSLPVSEDGERQSWQV